MAVSLVSANLSTVCMESFLYGIFFILSITSIYLLILRHRQASNRSMGHDGKLKLTSYMSPMLCAAVCLLFTVTVHWVCTVTRVFQAFVRFEDGTAPSAFYGDLAQLSEVIKTGFLMISLIIGDAMIIYRLWIVWNYNYTIILFPVGALIGLTVCGAGITYQLTQLTIGENIFDSLAGRWINCDCVFTLCTNIYSTATIAWKVWNANRVVREYGGGSLLPVLAAFVESAALYTSWTVFFFITYQTRTNLQFPAVDIWPLMSGIAFMLINVRVGMGWAQKASQQTIEPTTAVFASPSEAFGNQTQISTFQLKPLAVNITRVVDRDDLAASDQKDSESGRVNFSDKTLDKTQPV